MSTTTTPLLLLTGIRTQTCHIFINERVDPPQSIPKHGTNSHFNTIQFTKYDMPHALVKLVEVDDQIKRSAINKLVARLTGIWRKTAHGIPIP